MCRPEEVVDVTGGRWLNVSKHNGDDVSELVIYANMRNCLEMTVSLHLTEADNDSKRKLHAARTAF